MRTYYLKFLFVLLSFQFLRTTCNILQGHRLTHILRFPVKDDVIKVLNQIPSKDFCLWSSRFEEESFVSELSKEFLNSFKPVSIFQFESINTLPTICLHNVLVFTDFANCSNLLSKDLPLLTSHNFYVIVAGQLEFEVDELNKCSEQFGPARVVFVSLGNFRIFSLSSPLFLPRQFVSADLTAVLQQSDVSSRTLQGRDVNVASFNCTPFVIFDKSNNSEEGTGIEWAVLKELSRLLDFRVKLVELKGDRKWGAEINGTWNGGIALALAEGTADLGLCNIWNTLRYYRIMDFGPPVNVVTFTFIVPRPRIVEHRWQSLVNIFTWNVWASTLMAYLVYTTCYWLFCNSRSHRLSINPGEGMLTMFGILCLTSWWTRTANSSVRLVVTWWCVFALLLTTVYNSSIAARLTLPRYEPRIDTVKQLVDMGFHWYDKNYTSHDKQSVYFNMANWWQRQWEKRYVFVPTKRVLAALRTHEFAFPVQRWGSSLVFFDTDGLDPERDLEDMRVLKETTTETFVSFGFAKRSPIYHICQIALLRMTQSGLVNHWASEIVRKRTGKYEKQLLLETDVVDKNEPKQLAMVSLGPVFFILALGLLLSLLIFLREVLENRQNRKKSFIPFMK